MEDQKTNGGLFHTSAKGRVPPLVTTDFTVVDQGNASKSIYNFSIFSIISLLILIFYIHNQLYFFRSTLYT